MVAAIGILGAVGYSVSENVRVGAQERKLESDAAALNRALQLYQANGGTGDLSANFSGPAISGAVRMLQTRASSGSADQVVGVRGAFFDERAIPVIQNASEAATGQARIVWDAANRAFVVARSGGIGIREFRYAAPGEANPTPTAEARDTTLTGATETKWVWDFAAAAPNDPRIGTAPAPGTGTAAGNSTAPALTTLSTPTLTPTPGNYSLIQYDLTVTASNPNPAGSSQLYVQTGGGAYRLYTGPFTVAPGTAVSAVAFSNDPTRFSNSGTATGTYTTTPVQLQVSVSAPSSLTYAQAGGQLQGLPLQTAPSATITLTNTDIPAAYRTASNFQIVYTLDGSNPLTSATAQSGTSVGLGLAGWGNSTTLSVRAAARALTTAFLTNSAVATATVSASPTVLAAPIINPATATSSSVNVTITEGANYPPGARIQYTNDGTDPGAGPSPTRGIAYTGPFISGPATINTRAYGPLAYAAWFTQSPTVAATYSGTSLPEGALVGSADINGTFVGSLIYARPSGNINFNSGSRIVGGNVYFPGLPEVIIQPTRVVAAGADFNQATPVSRSFIQGREFRSDGTEVLPAADTRQIVDLTGARTPSNYLVRLNNNTVIEGKLFRRADPPPFPTVTIPTGLPTRGSVTQNSGAAPVNLVGGDYSSVTVNGGTVIRLGVAGSTTPTRYIFRNFNLNGDARVEVLGPVELTIPNGFNVNSSILGNIARPDWLELLIPNGGMNMNSSSTTYAAVVAPTSTVILNGTFNGSVVANQLTVNGNGIAFTIPPVIDG